MNERDELYKGVKKLIKSGKPVRHGHVLEQIKSMSKPRNQKEIEREKSEARLAMLQGAYPKG
jgi:hypothetical protein